MRLLPIQQVAVNEKVYNALEQTKEWKSRGNTLLEKHHYKTFTGTMSILNRLPLDMLVDIVRCGYKLNK